MIGLHVIVKMVNTRSHKVSQDETSHSTEVDTEVETLKHEVQRLTLENECLVKQLRLIGDEHDNVLQKLKLYEKGKTINPIVQKEKKRQKEASKRNEETNDISEDVNRCTNILIEAIFDAECKSVSHNACNQPKISNPKQITPLNQCDKTVSSQKRTSNSNSRIMDRKAETNVITIGTSLVKDLYLRSAGVQGITYCYPGQYVDFIRSRVPHII